MTLFGGDPDTPDADEPSREPRPHWQAVTGLTRCDACVTASLAHARNGHDYLPPNPARWRRTYKTSDTRLCYEHGRERRAADDKIAAELDAKGR